MAAHSSLTVADHILMKASQQDLEITPLQLMKLVYISHGWMLGLYGQPLFSDSVKAWKYGPGIPELYRKIKKYRASPITDKLSDSNEKFSEEESDIIGQVVEIYGEFSGIELSAMTHEEGTPWYDTWREGGKFSNIPDSLIEEHFKMLAA